MQSTSASAKPRFSLRDAFAALQYPNFNYWIRGQVAAMLGYWMQITAQGILVFELTRSPAYLGYVSFATSIPVWFFTLYAGVLTDRIERRKLMLVTQSVMMLLSLILAVLVFSGMVLPWHILVLAFFGGAASAFDTPARLTLVGDMVDRKHMTNAVALNGVLFNAGAAVGPAVASVAYVLLGPAWCFLLNALAFLGVIAALLKMKLPPQAKSEVQAQFWPEVIESLKYLWNNKNVLGIIAMAAVTCMFGLSITNIFPAWASNVLGGDTEISGWLQSARGVGSFTSVLIIMFFSMLLHKGRTVVISGLIYPILLILFTFTTWLPLSLFLLYTSGVALILVMNLSQSMVQTMIPDRLRGRIMAIYSLNFFGLVPIGSLMIGAAAEYWNEPVAVFGSAALALACMVSLWFLVPWLRKTA